MSRRGWQHLVAGVTLAWSLSVQGGVAVVGAVDKGTFQYSEAQAWPSETLDLAPITAHVARVASSHCGSQLSAAPLTAAPPTPASTTGSSKGKGAMGKLVGGLLGAPGRRSRPRLSKDPVGKKRKQTFQHSLRKAKLQLGGVLQDGALVLGARVARAPDQNSFHAIFIEQPDCQRLWPVRYEGYGLWGSWKLSVAVTKTTNSYRNGELQRSVVDRSGFTRNGRLNPASGFSILSNSGRAEGRRLLAPKEAFLQQLGASVGAPAWSQLGYSEPSGGIRHVGARFDVAEVAPSSIAVVHLAEQQGGRYSTIGFAARIAIQGEAVQFLPLSTIE